MTPTNDRDDPEAATRRLDDLARKIRNEVWSNDLNRYRDMEQQLTEAIRQMEDGTFDLDKFLENQ